MLLSLGTGIAPPECITYFDVYRPETFQELKAAPRILTGFSTLGRMIITQVSQNGQHPLILMAVPKNHKWVANWVASGPRMGVQRRADCGQHGRFPY